MNKKSLGVFAGILAAVLVILQQYIAQMPDEAPVSVSAEPVASADAGVSDAGE
jgi:hypothetical protein